MSCCQTSYDEKFDLKRAQEELQNYLNGQMRENTRPLVNLLTELPLEDQTLLDIGAGIGTITFELFKKGIQKSTYNDISQAYLDTFLKEVEVRKLKEKIKWTKGSFVDIHTKIYSADLVVLDKVICCFPDFKKLVTHSVSKTNRWYAYSIPKNVWWVKWAHTMKEWRKRRKGDLFPTFVHSSNMIEELIEQQGLRKIKQFSKREWLYTLYEK